MRTVVVGVLLTSLIVGVWLVYPISTWFGGEHSLDELTHRLDVLVEELDASFVERGSEKWTRMCNTNMDWIQAQHESNCTNFVANNTSCRERSCCDHPIFLQHILDTFALCFGPD